MESRRGPRPAVEGTAWKGPKTGRTLVACAHPASRGRAGVKHRCHDQRRWAIGDRRCRRAGRLCRYREFLENFPLKLRPDASYATIACPRRGDKARFAALGARRRGWSGRSGRSGRLPRLADTTTGQRAVPVEFDGVWSERVAGIMLEVWRGPGSLPWTFLRRVWHGSAAVSGTRQRIRGAGRGGWAGRVEIRY